VPDKHTAFETAKLTSEEMDKLAESSRAWIQKGMQDDAKK
jgi:glutathione S-transferase